MFCFPISPRDATLGNSFFQMSSNARANEKKQKENSYEGITWSEMENKMHKLRRSISFRQIPSLDCETKLFNQYWNVFSL